MQLLLQPVQLLLQPVHLGLLGLQVRKTRWSASIALGRAGAVDLRGPHHCSRPNNTHNSTTAQPHTARPGWTKKRAGSVPPRPSALPGRWCRKALRSGRCLTSSFPFAAGATSIWARRQPPRAPPVFSDSAAAAACVVAVCPVMCVPPPQSPPPLLLLRLLVRARICLTHEFRVSFLATSKATRVLGCSWVLPIGADTLRQNGAAHQGRAAVPRGHCG